MNNIRVQMVTNCGMVLIVTVPSFFVAINEAQEAGYKIVSAVQLVS